jgi:hypothetical protein
MNLESRLRTGIAMLLLSLIILTFFFIQQENELKKYKSEIKFISGGDIEKEQLREQVDSLRDELFIEKVDAGRHELTREEIFGKYPKVAKEYDEYYSHQTE